MDPSYSPSLPILPFRFRFVKDKHHSFYRHKLTRLLAGTTAPAAAAHDIDACITRAAEQRHHALVARIKAARAAQKKGPDYEICPDPVSTISTLFSLLSDHCTVYPPFHPAQTRIVEFLAALKEIPPHGVFNGWPPRGLSRPVRRVRLWGSDEGLGLGEFVRQLEEDGYELYRHLTSAHNPKTVLRWRYLQSAAARITVARICDFRAICALAYITPSSGSYPDIEDDELDETDWAKEISASVLASAEWILPDGLGEYVFRRCLERETINWEMSGVWSRESWVVWKHQMGFVAREGRFSEEARRVAREILTRMVGIEEVWVADLESSMVDSLI
ncbi:hypothetical protein BO71DRAFT_397847 [Aspergillus ellipticus CBS 707.79]|uniref:Uncharacterized protein n=1 Tax=Aspergillus ellipticus CBS 707.79 TaxID=1448320 RepID=A0A319DE16_9EURO|nr:hypothetical protein BO71DRAFT_397847 [Aspergillus ellipticus CBS 707.79]